MQVFEKFVTPITPYLICKHFISTEIHHTTKECMDGYPCLLDISDPNAKPLDVKIKRE